MNFKQYYKGLDRAGREAYAKRVGTSTNYIENHYIHARKVPRVERMSKLATESLGACSNKDMLDHFYNLPQLESNAV